MTIEAPPLWLQGGTYPARLDRFSLAKMFDEGVMKPSHCKVTQRAAGANFSVDVAIGEFVIQGDDQTNQGNYLGRITAVENAAIAAAPGSNSRYDLVTLRVNDPNAGGNTGNTVTVVVITGTASASPVVPSLPASSLPLAVVGPIATATASITNSLINDSFGSGGPTFARSCRMIAGPVEPVGTEKLMGGSSVLNGWLVCDGTAVSRSTYAELFLELGTTFGVGDGSTTFNLPDYRDRVPVASGTNFATVGATGGEINHTLTTGEMPTHNHGVTDPTHSHGVTDPTHLHGVGSELIVGGGFSNFVVGSGVAVNTRSNTDAASTGISINAASTGISTNNAGSGTAHNNMPPYQVSKRWWIRT
jgi:microcystin-dependent protein